jgi:hypothetical protein
MHRGLTIAQVVERGPLSRSSIYQAIAEGRLVARKSGRKTIIFERDWEAFLEALPRIPPRATRLSKAK